jgi:hypothetical protein
MMAGRKTLMRLEDVLAEIDASDWDNDPDFSSDDDSDLECKLCHSIQVYFAKFSTSWPGRGWGSAYGCEE